MQLIPARGRLLFDVIPRENRSQMQLSPARGRLPGCKGFGLRSPVGCSLAPRGDGYAQAELSRANQQRCSLAPRGDGYLSSRVFFTVHRKMQLSPARGRLHHFANFIRAERTDAA